MIHFAKIESSPRLQSLLSILRDGQEHSSWELAHATRSLAIGTDISELRRNNFSVERIYRGRNQNGRQMNYYRLCGQIELSPKQKEVRHV